MRQIAVLCFIFALPWKIYGQDERYFRQIFSGELARSAEAAKIEKKYTFFVHTPYYLLDINGDGVSEQVVFIKKDSEDWIEILNQDKKKVFSYQFENKGFESELYKIELKSLSPSTNILLLHYYEGMSRYLNFQGTSRIYAITIDNGDLSTLAAFKGVSFFDESKTSRGHYHKRLYDVYLEDLNQDSIKELVIKQREISTVFLYKGNGKWQSFNH